MTSLNNINDLNKTNEDRKRIVEEARRLKLLQATSKGNSSYINSRNKNHNLDLSDEEFSGEDLSREGVVDISLKDIVPYEFQVRKAFDNEKLRELALDIHRRGVQIPIKVFKNRSGKYEVFNGERRFRASLIAGLEKIPAIIANESDALLDSYQDNDKRENLNILSRSLYFKILLDKGICSEPQEIASYLSVNPKVVYEGLNIINKLTKDEFDNLIKVPNISRDEIRKIIKSKNISSTSQGRADVGKFNNISLKVKFTDSQAIIRDHQKLSRDQLILLAETIATLLG